MTIDAQLEALDQSAIEYAAIIADPKWTNEQMVAYWNYVGQGWMLVIGLRKAQIKSLYHGMALVA